VLVEEMDDDVVGIPGPLGEVNPFKSHASRVMSTSLARDVR
jgi:hypothetical protein